MKQVEGMKKRDEAGQAVWTGRPTYVRQKDRQAAMAGYGRRRLRRKKMR